MPLPRMTSISLNGQMNARIVDGRACADNLDDKITGFIPDFVQEAGRAPGFAVVLVGTDPASEIYVRSKGRMAGRLEMISVEHVLPADASHKRLWELIAELNANGILVQLPLPAHLDQFSVIEAIDPAKDVDGLHPLRVGRLSWGLPGLVSCTPFGCLMLAKSVLGHLSGLDAIVVGRSILAGKPMAQLLLAESCTVTIAHSRTRDLAARIRKADVVVAALGRAHMIRGDRIKPGAVVIDVGINRIERDGRTALSGDVEFTAACERAAAATPVPSGVGPMTIMNLMHDTLIAAYMRQGLPAPRLQ